MKRISALLVATLLVVAPLSVRPLGLGEIELRSFLNAPLDARIPLHSVKEGDVSGMRVELGTKEQFRRAGIERSFILSKLRFAAVEEGGEAYVHITTARPVAEPFLNFLLDVEWRSGHTVREYTLLLDPPVYGAAISTHVKEAVTTVAEPPAASAAASGTEQTAPAAPSSAAPAALRPGATYGPVGSTDTLWSLADRFRGDASVSIQQMMLAMLGINPDAFSEGNINLLREGAVLRIPTVEQTRALSREEALHEVQRQHAAWEDYRQALGAQAARPAPVVAAAPQAASAGSAPTPAAGTPAGSREGDEAKLKLVSGGQARGGVGSASAGTAEISALREELERVREAADANRRESEELAGRLEEAEGLVSELERLVEVRSRELEALQRKLSESESAVAAQAAAPGGSAAQPAGAAAPAPQVKKTVPLPPPAPAEPTSFVDLIRSQLEFLPVDPILFLGGLIVVIVLVVIALVFARRKKAEQGEAIAAPAKTAVAAPAVAPAATGAGARDLGIEQTQIFSVDADVAESAAVAAEPAGAALEDQQRTQIREPEDDPLAEVNVYLAYERFEQAETLVKDAIAAHPDRHEYKLKLLEIYHAAQNIAAFELGARALQEAVGGDHELMETARAWWSEISPGRELFAEPTGEAGGEPDLGGGEDEIFDVTGGALPAGGPFRPGETTTQLSDGVDASQGVDFDLGLDFDQDGDALTGEGTNVDFELDLDADEGSAAGRSGGDTDLDFDLGEIEGADLEAGAGADTAVVGEDTGLDFDLGGFDIDTEADAAAATELPEAATELPEAATELPEAATELPEEDSGAGTEVDFVLDEPEAERPGPGAAAPAGDTDLDFDLGDFAETTTEAPVRTGESEDDDSGASGDASPAAVGDDTGSGAEDLDFDLDLDSLADTTELPSAEDAGGTDLEFDLEVPGAGDAAVATEDGTGLDTGLGEDLDLGGAADTALSTVELKPGGADEGGADTALDFGLEIGGAGSGGAEGDSDTGVDFDLSFDDVAEPTEEPEAAAGGDVGLEIDEDFAGLFTPDDGAGAGPDTPPVQAEDTLGGELTELDLVSEAGDDEDPTDVPAPVAPPPEDTGLDLDALLSTDDGADSDEEFSGIFDDLPAEATAADDEVTDLNLSDAAAELPSGPDDDVLDLDLGDFADADAGAGEELTDTGVDFDLGGLDLDVTEPADDTVEPIEDSEDRTLALGRGPEGEADEMQTKLDLAQAYIDMGDSDGAKGILGEVMADGNESQRAAAQALLKGLS